MPKDEYEPVAVTAGQVVARRLREVRERKGWSLQRLSERLGELGYPIHRVTLGKIEKAGTRARNVGIEDLLAIAVALDVAPLHLFVPFSEDERLQLTPKVTVHPVNARHWVRGRGLVGDTDIRFYFTELPPEEVEAAWRAVEEAEAESPLPAPAHYLRDKEQNDGR